MHRSHRIAAAWLAAGLSACSVLATPSPTSTPAPPTAISTVTPTPTAIPSPTPPACLTAAGSVTKHTVGNERPPQEFLIYLPPCYDYDTDQRYPVLYLLHGQTFEDDQWVRLGAPVAVDNLIHRGDAAPFIIVFPDDRYWNLPAGGTFGQRLIDEVIPYIDKTYRTRAERPYRALGGLSRGGGWAVHQLLTRYDLFGMIGLHSPVIFNDDAAILERLIPRIPDEAWPRLWIDAGDHDGDLGSIRRFEELLTVDRVAHEWHVYSGDHTEGYWQRHIDEYMQWYAEGFRAPAAQAAVPTPAP
ncbi:MAG TPA: alpha/beta hydrolase-fold protein [Anaerolineales bacterium]|nr:alpha/beta hydrolase-fold protein [Anaerolineales bacterium]